MALSVAYSLAIQAMMASVGLGMSAGAAPDQLSFVLCSYVSHQSAPGDRRAPTPQCPFCFVAAQSAGHVATVGGAPAFPANAGLLIAAISHPLVDGTFVPQLRHRQGEPRAPPSLSV
ncbi:MAG TPA: hypothetical protein VHY10_04680 [Xanthobacteraceae bacterium]|nr:hypothetical protein [Xanthobacteraceae bacterium]